MDSTLSFEDISKTVMDGDLLFLQKSKNSSPIARMISRVVKAATQGKFYHVGIILVITINGKKQPYVVEANTGERRLIPLTTYKNYKFTILENIVPVKSYASELISGIGKTRYSNLDALSIGIKEFFGIEAINRDFTGEVCSELVAKLLNINLEEKIEPLISPHKLYEELIKRNARIKFKLEG